jgi:tetratricopeptide (TPR) repeat protein/TolB-like protein
MEVRRVLDNWKEIAAYLGRTGKTCRNWEKEYGLPVHRLDGSPRAHVFAYADEIDRWKEKLLREEPAASREITVKFSLKKLFVAAAFGLLILAAALAVFFKSRGPHYDPKRIIVAVFENQTGDKTQDVLGRIASDWITQGLSRAGIAEVVEAAPGEAAPGTPKETERIRALAREAGAGTLVSGAYFLQGKTLSFHARVSDMSNGKLIKALDPIGGPVEEPMKSIEFLRQKVIGALAEISDFRLMPVMNISGQPPTYEAYKEFADGQDAFARQDWSRALKFFLRAAELEPSFKRPLLRAVTAYQNLGQYAAGEKLIDELEKVRETMSPYDQLSFDYKKACYQGDLAGQLRLSRQLVSRIKGIYLYQWGLDATANNRPREAVKALSMLDPEGIWLKDWPQYWSVMTLAYHMLGRYRAELKQARRGRRQFPEIIWLLLHEVRALAALGRIEEIDGLIDQSLNMKSDKWPAGRNITAREIYDPGWLMNKAGQELRVHGFQKGSLQMFDRAVRWLQARPDEEKAKKDCRQQLAYAYYGVGRWPEARILAEGLLKEDPENVNYLRMCGALAAKRGDREEAFRISKQLEEIKGPYLWGRPTYHRACIASLLGEKEAAVRLLQEAVSQGREYRYLYEDMDLDPLRDYPPFKELIRPKG